MKSKALYIFIISMLFSVSVFAQTSAEKDPLLESLRSKSDMVRLDTLLKMCWKFRARNTEKALKYGKIALKIADKHHLYEKKAQSYNYIGVIYRNMSEYDSSFFNYKRALNNAVIVNDSIQIAYSFNNIGGYYGYKEKYFLALKNIFQAREIFEKLHNLRGIAFTDIQAGLWFSQLKLYDKAEKYFVETIQIRRKIHDEFGIYVAQGRLAYIYFNQKLYDKALSYYILTLNKFIDLDNPFGIENAYSGLGGVAYYQERYGQALAYLLKALNLAEKINFKIGIVINYNRLGLVYHALNEDDKAFAVLQKSENIAKKIQYYDGLIELYHNYMVILSHSNPDKAIDYAKKYVELREKRSVEESRKRIEELQTILDAGKIIKNNQQLKSDLSHSRTLLTIFIFIGFLFSFFFVIILLQNKKVKQKEKELTVALEEKNKLFSIVAHDLKNPFSTLLGYTDLILTDFNNYDKNDLHEAISTLRGSSQKLLDMVENILTWARSQTGTIKVQKAVYPLNSIILKTVSYFTQSANSKNIDLKVNFDNQPHCYCDEDLFSTALRNLINNCLKFTSSGGQITVSTKIDKTNNNAMVIVADTGIGMTEEEVKNLWNVNKVSGVGTAGEKGTGLGLILVKESVELNSGTLRVESEKGLGTEIVFTVPLTESKSKEEEPHTA